MSLRPLGGAIAAWSRGALPQTQLGPLDAVIDAWPGIVGPAIAQQTAPHEVSGTTLIVATRSSAWSQQLQFLEPQILAALRVMPAAAAIERLRFRSNHRLPVRRAALLGAPAPPQVRARPESAYTPAANLDEALVRLRTRFGRPQPGFACAGCSAPLVAGRRWCGPCGEAARTERAAAAQRLLYEAPWLGREAILDLVPELTVGEYERSRRALLARWWLMLDRARRAKAVTREGVERRIASSYVILQSRLPPDRISSAVVRNVLGDQLAELLFGARAGAGDARTESVLATAKMTDR